LEDLQVEIPDDDEVSAVAKLRALMKKYPQLESLTRGSDGARMESPIKTLNELNKVLEELASFDLSAFSYDSDGYEIKPGFVARLDTMVAQLKEILRRNFDESEISDFELDLFSKIIAYSNQTTTFSNRPSSPRAMASQLMSEYGISLINPNASAVRDITYPGQLVGDSYRPVGDRRNYEVAISAIQLLNSYVDDGEINIPPTIDLDSIPMEFISDPDKFVRVYRSVSPNKKETEKQIKTEVLGSNSARPKNSKTVNSQSTMQEMKSNIIFNLPAIDAKMSEFGADSIAETIFHEFAHTLHRGLGIGFGGSKNAIYTAGRELNARYRAAKAEFVTDYGAKSIAEHFSETFAKYIITGKAGPEWTAFMKNVGILKD
jgi:hypothetical protein